jgi:putative transposase
MRAQTAISERRACGLVGISRTVLLYEARPDRCPDLSGRIVELAQQRRRFGYRRIGVLLRREGYSVNDKAVYRRYRERGLIVGRRKRRQSLAVPRQPLVQPAQANAVWSLDFVCDALANGRRLKILTVIDDYTRQALAVEVHRAISGAHVARILERVALFRGYPLAIRTDQGPEFTGKALDQWASMRGVEIKMIQAGKPTQNAYIESFNGRLRDECLNDHWFTSLEHARDLIESWRQDYNEERPHSSLGQLSPNAFAAKGRLTDRSGRRAEVIQLRTS